MMAGEFSPLNYEYLRTEIRAGLFDYTEPLKKAINEAAINGGKVKLPNARLAFTETLYIPERNKFKYLTQILIIKSIMYLKHYIGAD